MFPTSSIRARAVQPADGISCTRFGPRQRAPATHSDPLFLVIPSMTVSPLTLGSAERFEQRTAKPPRRKPFQPTIAGAKQASSEEILRAENEEVRLQPHPPNLPHKP